MTTLKNSLLRCADEINDLRTDWLFDESLNPTGLAESKFLQALALLEQAQHVMKEASYHA